MANGTDAKLAESNGVWASRWRIDLRGRGKTTNQKGCLPCAAPSAAGTYLRGRRLDKPTHFSGSSKSPLPPQRVVLCHLELCPGQVKFWEDLLQKALGRSPQPQSPAGGDGAAATDGLDDPVEVLRLRPR